METLVEREAELAELARAVSEVAAGRSAAIALEGPVGIGKSELVREALAMGRAGGLAPFLARASDEERQVPFGVVRQLLEPALAARDDATRDSLFAGAAELARPLVDRRAAPVAKLPGPAVDRFALLHGLYWLVVELADGGPLLLAVDDLQWADAPSLEWLAFLARRLEGLPVLLTVAARRPDVATGEEVERFLATLPARTVRPAPLSRAGTGRLVRERLPEAPDAFCDGVHAATGGNPFFLLELVSARRQAPVGSAGWTELVASTTPAVSARVNQRLAVLPPDSAAVGLAAAVLGDGASLRLVAELAELELGAAARAREALERAEVLRPGEPLEFTHPIVRAAIADGLPPATRRRLRRRAAVLLAEREEWTAAATHLLAVPPALDPEVVDVLRVAIRGALREGAPDVAAAFAARALDEPPGPEERPHVELELGSALRRCGREGAEAPLRAALDALLEPDDRGAAARELVQLLLDAGRVPEAIALIDEVVPALGAPAVVDELEAKRIDYLRLEPGGREELLRRLNGRAVSLDGGVADRIRLAHIAYELAATPGPAEKVADAAERALADEAPIDSAAPYFAAVALCISGRMAQADRRVTGFIARAQRTGTVGTFMGASGLRARLRFLQGRLLDAEADAQAMRALDDEGSLGTLLVAATHAEVLLAQGRVDEAEAALGGSEGTPGVALDDLLLHAHGRLDLARGEHAAALARFTEAGEAAERGGHRNPALVPWRSGVALAQHALGHAGEALLAAEEEVALGRTFGAAPALGPALRVRGIVSGPERGLEDLRASVELLEASEARLERVISRAALASALLETGDRDGARATARGAVEEATAIAAGAAEADAVAVLVAAGGRPRAAARTGGTALTAAEWRVSGLAREGLTNREIAQRLFVTEKTVEGHLANVFRKLGIRSRGQLEQALGTDPGA